MSNKRMNVYTDEGIYILLLDEEQQYTDQAINELINDLNVAGTIWNGWTPYDDPATTAPGIIAFGVDAAIKSIKIYDADAIPIGVSDNIADCPLVETAIPTQIDLEYLGNKCSVKMFMYYHESGTTFDVLPYEVNGVAAPNALSPANLTTMLTAHYTEMGVPASDFRVIAPEVPLTEIDAAKYIVAYNEGNDVPMSKKAKAWHGWNNTSDDDSDDEG